MLFGLPIFSGREGDEKGLPTAKSRRCFFWPPVQSFPWEVTDLGCLSLPVWDSGNARSGSPVGVGSGWDLEGVRAQCHSSSPEVPSQPICLSFSYLSSPVVVT